MAEEQGLPAIPPGETIRELLSDRGIRKAEFASKMGMSEEQVDELMRGDVALTPDVAEKLKAVFGVPAKFWTNLEAIYREDFAKTRG